MAAYVDYTYYTTTYGGSAISSAEFTAYANRASAYIDYVTMDRAVSLMSLSSPSPEETAQIAKVKNAVCAVMDQLKSYDITGGGSISSESVGSHSVSYSTADRKVHAAQMTDAAALYLAHTGLMFRGFNADEYGSNTLFTWD